MFNLTQLISEATRVTENSATLIDHILSNTCENCVSLEPLVQVLVIIFWYILQEKL